MFSLIDMLRAPPAPPTSATPHAHEPPTPPIINIVDVGALWMGEEDVAYRAIMRSGLGRLVGFEAVKEECDKLNALGRPNERYLPYFIGDGADRQFCQNNFVMTSSLYEPNRRLVDLFNSLGEVMRPVKREKVKTTRIDDVPEIERIDYLKMDIQGAELDALRGAAKRLADAVVIHTEVEFVPLYTGQPLFAEVDAELRGHGFLLHSFPGIAGRAFKPLVAEGDATRPVNQVLWADAVYVRDFSKLELLTPEQLLRTAIIVHEVYQSCDLAALCLRHYDAQLKTALTPLYMQRLTTPPSST
jgi:FkbM family methyltransferase